MYHRVKIKRLPNKALGGTKTGQQTVDGALSIQPTAMGGADIDQYIGEKPSSVQKTLQPISREGANVEVEKGEIVAGDLNGDGMLETYVAGGKRHSQGGTPLNLPDDTFIFSDTASMRIKDPSILAKFGKTTGSYTPADLAKQYDINKYRKILQDLNSDAIDKKTAELMIRNYTMKLGGLALAQESKKGFPQGIPLLSQPFLKANGISEEQILPKYEPKLAKEGEEMESAEEDSAEPQQEVAYDESMPTQMPNGEPIAMSPEMMEGTPMGAYGMMMGGFGMPYHEYAMGGLVKAQEGLNKIPPYSEKDAYSPKGVVELNKYRRMYGLPQLRGSVSKSDIQKAAGELQSKIIESNPELVVDYMTTRSHQPNKELLKIIPSGYPKTTAGAKQAVADGKLTADQVKGAYKDNLWWYRALETNTKELSPEEYEKKMKEPGSIKQGDLLYFNDNPDNPSQYTTYVMKDGKKANTVDVPEDAPKGPASKVERPSLQELPIPGRAPEFTGMYIDPIDRRNYLNALRNRYSFRTYYPYAPAVHYAQADPTMLDPLRELTAASEAQAQEANAMSQFLGPQYASSRSSQRQGMLAKQAANIIPKYYSMNAQIANQFGLTNTNLINSERQANNQIAKTLYDDTTRALQARDNYLRESTNQITQAKNQMDSNAMKLSLVNSMSDQYDIIPGQGVWFQGGKDIAPEKSRRLSERANELKAQGWKDELAVKMAEKEVLGTSSPGVDYDALLANLQYSKDGGGVYVMGSNVFPFMFY
jgi:hypothetical protein